MKKILIFLFFFSLSTYAQDKNKLTIDERSAKPMLIGICDRTAFVDTNFSWWFKSEYDNYEINLTSSDSIKSNLVDLAITIVLGTWCSDSRREVPRFLKLIDSVQLDNERFSIICVDRKKESPEGNVADLNIKFVPTFIIYRGNKEIGRIIETPNKSLEQDLLEIICQK